ncbi:hypothetical protein BJ912DRAFT_1066319 [Pholiota molesta]|nr:hypothetical protein BJ912DRAFT_1066319 [Pholiota molesta]
MDPPTLPTRSIRDYFTRTTTRADAQHRTSEHGETSHEPSAKKIRITAENGRDIALRGVQESKVKRERTEDSVGTSKGARVARRTGRAKLGLLPSVPLDVLFEIFSHLAPLDLLRLSRTTKELRRLLLNRSSTFVWKAALSTVEGLPACPEDMSLPCWTNLIFDHHCQNCLAKNVKKCDFALRVRYCKKCANDKLLQQSAFEPNNSLHQIILKAVPFSNWNMGNRVEKRCTVADRDRLLDEIEVVIESEDRNAIADFVAKKCAEIDARLAHAQTCKTWMNDLLRSRERELADCRKSRAEAIRAKLIGLGYQAELDFLDELKAGVCAINPWPRIVKFEDHPLVKPAKPLTEKTWAAMKDEMIKYITEASGLRKENMHCIAIRTRTALVYTAYVSWRRKPENLSRYPADVPMPNLADVLDFPPIKGMVHARTERELDMDRVVSCLARSLHDEIEEWREDIASDLLGKVTRSRVWDDAQWWYEMAGDFWDKRLRFFERAVVVFRCTNRWMHYRWEEQRLRADVVFPAGTPNVPFAISMAAQNEDHAPVMDEQVLRAILEACRMDWKKTTMLVCR